MLECVRLWSGGGRIPQKRVRRAVRLPCRPTRRNGYGYLAAARRPLLRAQGCRRRNEYAGRGGDGFPSSQVCECPLLIWRTYTWRTGEHGACRRRGRAAETGTLAVRSLTCLVRRSRYALRSRCRLQWFAEVGTPQKRVRWGSMNPVRPARRNGYGTESDTRFGHIGRLYHALYRGHIPASTPVRRRNGYAAGGAPLWISLCNGEVIPAETGSPLSLKQVRVYADSGSTLRRIEYAAAQNRVRSEPVYVYGSTA